MVVMFWLVAEMVKAVILAPVYIYRACRDLAGFHDRGRTRKVQRMYLQQVQAPPQVRVWPPGWYPDPSDNLALCWWDGQRWYPHTKHYPQFAVRR